MMRAEIDGRRVYCARPGCHALIGHLDGGKLGLSARWHWLGDERPPRWRIGERTRLLRASEAARRGPPGTTMVRWPKEGDTWVIPVPVAVECHRCHAAQNVDVPYQ